MNFTISTNLIILFLIFFALFFVPQAFVGRSIILYPVICLIFAFKYFFSNNKISLPLFFLVALNIVLGFFINIIFLYLALAFIFVDFLKQNAFNREDIKVIYNLASFAIIIQLAFFALFFDTYRVGLGTDPNFSAVTIFILMILGARLNSPLIYVLFFFGLLITFSRLLVAMSALLFLYRFIRKIKFFRDFFDYTHLKPILLFVVINAVGIIFFYLYLGYFDYSNSLRSSESILRIVEINDYSNLGRITQNILWFNLIIQDSFFFTNSIDVEDSSALGISQLIPHNSMIYGVVTSTYFYLLMVIIFFGALGRNLKDVEQSVYLYIYLIGSLFLHGLYSPIFLISATLSIGLNISSTEK